MIMEFVNLASDNLKKKHVILIIKMYQRSASCKKRGINNHTCYKIEVKKVGIPLWLKEYAEDSELRGSEFLFLMESISFKWWENPGFSFVLMSSWWSWYHQTSRRTFWTVYEHREKATGMFAIKNSSNKVNRDIRFLILRGIHHKKCKKAYTKTRNLCKR